MKYIQITAGRGPTECSWVVAQVLKIILKEAKGQGFVVNVLHQVKGEINRTLFSATVEIDGKETELIAFVKKWVGTIQWIGKSQFRKFHKRKNWFIGVNELDLSNQNIVVKDQHIKYEAIRSGGPGGQHVNKVSTAIRATHLLSRLSVLASDSRSQLQNKKKAKERLINLIKMKEVDNQKSNIKANWQKHNELERGNPIRTFRGQDFKRAVVKNVNKTSRQKAKNELREW